MTGSAPTPRSFDRTPARALPAADERFLVAAAQRRDVQAFAELTRRHEVPVYRLALRMLGSPADAEDAAQDAFLQAWRAIPRFRGNSSFSTWMYRITTNRCLNLIAARRPTDEFDPDRDGGTAADPAVLAEQRERLGALTAAIGRLPAEQRAALALREFEGLSYEEVAEVLEITLPAVKGRIHRARLALAEELGALR